MSKFSKEAQSRIVVSVSPGMVAKLNTLARKWRVPVTTLGKVGGGRVRIGNYVDLPLVEAEKAWRNGLRQPSSAA